MNSDSRWREWIENFTQTKIKTLVRSLIRKDWWCKVVHRSEAIIDFKQLKIRFRYNLSLRSTWWKTKRGWKRIFDWVLIAWKNWLRKRHQVLLMFRWSFNDSWRSIASQWPKRRQNTCRGVIKERKRLKLIQNASWC